MYKSGEYYLEMHRNMNPFALHMQSCSTEYWLHRNNRTASIMMND